MTTRIWRDEAQGKVFATGADDISAIVLNYNGSPRRNRAYSPHCPCCYLGFGHTLAYHDQAKAEFRAACDRHIVPESDGAPC